jgi:hypothetical protein
MWWSVIIRYVIACARGQRVRRTILVFDDELARNNEDNMSLATPVVRNVPGAVIDKTKLDISTPM